MSTLDAAQVTAWATVILAALALIAAVVAGGAWAVQARQLADLRRVNAEQLPVLEGQRAELAAAAELRQRAERERHEQFVTQVFCWYEIGPRLPKPAGAAPDAEQRTEGVTYVRNTGDVPVYDIAFSVWAEGKMHGWRQYAKPLMPAKHSEPAESTEQCSWSVPVDPDLLAMKIEVAVFIRDAAGNRWRLRPGGYYDEYTDDMVPMPNFWTAT